MNANTECYVTELYWQFIFHVFETEVQMGCVLLSEHEHRVHTFQIRCHFLHDIELLYKLPWEEMNVSDVDSILFGKYNEP